MGIKRMAEFRFLGHNCVRIKAREATVLTDPVGRSTGYLMPKQTADIVTISHDHPGHANLAAVKPDYQVVHGPGEYEMHEVFITGIRTYHDAERGKQRGYNTVYLIELEGLRIVHLGDLGHPLDTEQAEALDDCDVLLVPAGGGDIISPEQAAETIGLLGAKIVVPMQYATPVGDKKLGDLTQFCKSLGVDVPQPEDKLMLRHSDVGDTVRVVALQPESEPAKR